MELHADPDSPRQISDAMTRPLINGFKVTLYFVANDVFWLDDNDLVFLLRDHELGVLLFF